MTGSEAAFWQAAAYACVALRQSDSASWRSASESWFGGGRSFKATGCHAVRVRETMKKLMGSAPNPGAVPAITLGAPAQGFACRPRSLELTPREGPAGTPVTLSWTGAPWMHYSGEVLFGTTSANLIKDTEGSATVSAPEELTGPNSVVLTLDNGETLDFGTYTHR
ncbi:hypothetical protein LL946_02555 [Knoellia locipacati]|uniref:hypothetical protein n=1 Tax=Knoellia locipacati TaxID=882824 RepID=UPI00384AD63E